ncbi:hypothetical protein AVEN_175110-1 [Araneus ventricosus]|uniref:Uncharacterized protein n=1 Tax=Araneus ventricosus TaxID=182803 RepID=A0A4Y2UVY6_ARAVE|nr:hypothetical protein AVEN_175110-1 [Araneus ventricosus]
MISENATLFSIFLLGKGIHEKTPCDVTACRREYLRTALTSEERLYRLGARMPLEFYPQCELEQNTILPAKQTFAASASNNYSFGNEGETEIEDVMEVETEEGQEGTKDASYTPFEFKSFQQPTLSVQMDKTAFASHRFGVSNRATAVIASSVGFNIGIRHRPGQREK